MFQDASPSRPFLVSVFTVLEIVKFDCINISGTPCTSLSSKLFHYLSKILIHFRFRRLFQLGITGSCDYDANSMDTKATLRGYETLPRNNYEAVMDHIANVGPLSVAVDASSWSFYGGGVFEGCDYDQNIEINHGN